MTATLSGLDSYRLTLTDLRRLGDRPVEVSFTLLPPDYAPLFPLAPAERNAWLRDHLGGQLERVRARWPGGEIVPRLADHLPWTADSVLAARDVPRVLRLPELLFVSVTKIAGLRRKPERRQLAFFAVRARIVIEAEGQTKGSQEVEDRIVLVSAFSFADAERRVIPQLAAEAEPYLNADGEMVRWRLEEIVDVYQLFADAIDPRGTEVYSRIGQRRMKPELEWHPRDPAPKTRKSKETA